MFELPLSHLTKIWPVLKKQIFQSKKTRYSIGAIIDLFCIIFLLIHAAIPIQQLISPLITPLQPLNTSKNTKEIFGFAPWWNINKLDNVDFNVLTTFAYFGVDVDSSGDLDREDVGYQTFQSKKATELFKKAHSQGTRVVLTITQMDNDNIKALMDDPIAQQNAINQTVEEVRKRGIDGINVDFEYVGNPGPEYRHKFSQFVAALTNKMHQAEPESRVTVSVYASAVKDPKIYDIAFLGKSADGIFMMAYDFAVAGSDNAIPTAPLYGHETGKYWYDIASAVADFTKYMDPKKLILGVPYYGYNYLVYEPTIKAETRPYYSWRGTPKAQTYTTAKNDLNPNMEGVDEFKQGWDDNGKVGYMAYHIADTDTWRMLFLDDVKSLGLKYDFAKEKNLAGVGMWALGMDNGKTELWQLLAEKFGQKFADISISQKTINENN